MCMNQVSARFHRLVQADELLTPAWTYCTLRTVQLTSPLWVTTVGCREVIWCRTNLHSTHCIATGWYQQTCSTAHRHCCLHILCRTKCILVYSHAVTHRLRSRLKKARERRNFFNTDHRSTQRNREHPLVTSQSVSCLALHVR
jgi:hypothetical protein